MYNSMTSIRTTLLMLHVLGDFVVVFPRKFIPDDGKMYSIHCTTTTLTHLS